jgi:GNAT superfamily N-acetyltransferase
MPNNIRLRPITRADYENVCAVEAKSTPGLRYVPDVFEMFTTDPRGEFFLAEQGDEAVACAKFTALPDGTGWLETLRVIPEQQGRGIGKKLYERYFAIAQREDIHTLRMYTGLTNAVSKGLAEYFGFVLEETFLGFSKPGDAMGEGADAPAFQPVRDPARAAALLMPHAPAWGGFAVMNRTFYRWSPALCAHFAQRGCVHEDPATNSVVVLGARFAPQKALHLALFAGDETACVHFAESATHEAGAPRLHCLHPQPCTRISAALAAHGFAPDPAPYIVMKHEESV